MLLTISTTQAPATDLGYLLHKHPDRVQSFGLSMGTAHVFYPDRTPERCTATLLVEVDPIDLVRGRHGPAGEGFALGQYVNDRPYAASSMLALALKAVFGTAMTGRCPSRPELAATPIPLQIDVLALPCRGGIALVRTMFEPLGWTVEATVEDLDPEFPDWGPSGYATVRLTGEIRLAEALNHLYVLLPVLDDAKHYWVGIDEVDKLIRAGTGWLAGHPEKTLIAQRYLAHRRDLTGDALDRLAELDDTSNTDAGGQDVEASGVYDPPPPARETPLAELRRQAVLAALRGIEARRVGDFGCGEATLVRELLADRTIERVVAVDVSTRTLQRAAKRLQLDKMIDAQRDRISMFQSALTYTDDRLTGLDAAVLMEVIEHVDPPRLEALARSVFGSAAPGFVLITTPNAEYNVRFPAPPDGTFRHRDHRFEFSRAEFRAWAEQVAGSYGYSVAFTPIGPDDPEVGPPTQLAVFTRTAPASRSVDR